MPPRSRGQTEAGLLLLTIDARRGWGSGNFEWVPTATEEIWREGKGGLAARTAPPASKMSSICVCGDTYTQTHRHTHRPIHRYTYTETQMVLVLMMPRAIPRCSGTALAWS